MWLVLLIPFHTPMRYALWGGGGRERAGGGGLIRCKNKGLHGVGNVFLCCFFLFFLHKVSLML